VNSAAATLEVRGLSKRFPARAGQAESPWILADLSFTVRDSEFLTIVGPSGSGKTTLLNILCQVDAATGGEVVFRGKSVNLAAHALNPGWDCQFGYVTQDDNLLPWRSMIDNVTFPLKVQGRLDEHSMAKVNQLLKAVNLTGFERYFPHELSGGMRKRAGLARGMVMDPPLLFCDEPTSGLDPVTAAELDQLLLELKKSFDMTMVVVSHDLDSMRAIADHVVVLGDGRVLFNGLRDELEATTDDYLRRFLDRQAAARTSPRLTMPALDFKVMKRDCSKYLGED